MARQAIRKFDALLATADPRALPAYTIAEAAHYLNLPRATARAWATGTTYIHRGVKHSFRPVLKLPKSDRGLLSFFNLVEIHVLRSLRTFHDIRTQRIQVALRYVSQEFGWDRPLIRERFRTDGAPLFVERLGQSIGAADSGQLVIQAVTMHLDRVDWEDGLAARLYPFTRPGGPGGPRSVLIDARIAFGRPFLCAAGVATSIVAERYKCGDSIRLLADDYGCSQEEIEEGLRCEFNLQAAA